MLAERSWSLRKLCGFTQTLCDPFYPLGVPTNSNRLTQMLLRQTLLR
ncbi:hypothetical protein RBSWK_06419 [Rhodopirellula baltica SWK14]|uniref:Uncharacterized protein n=1 Tax=Rhodopirellula baltica SWK14 TaxID=993516 RepID=L7C6C1_RHOBT|nr:hypothetical protein RBSWK_06419 [Rhodopirellula baltica SWK14]